jgi:hypothetical protein
MFASFMYRRDGLDYAELEGLVPGKLVKASLKGLMIPSHLGDIRSSEFAWYGAIRHCSETVELVCGLYSVALC